MALTRDEQGLIDHLRAKVRGMDFVRLTEVDVAARLARHSNSLASLAMENMFMDEADTAFQAMLFEERVPAGIDTKVIVEFTHGYAALSERGDSAVACKLETAHAA